MSVTHKVFRWYLENKVQLLPLALRRLGMRGQKYTEYIRGKAKCDKLQEGRKAPGSLGGNTELF